MAFIGLGHCKFYYIYIFILVFFQFISDYLIGFYEKTYREKSDNESFWEFGSIFSYHPLFKNLMFFFSAIICGLIFYIIYLKNEKAKEGMLSIDDIDSIRTKMLGLKSCYGYLDLISTCIIYILNVLLRTFLTSMKFDAGFWTVEIIFIIYLSVKLLKVKIGNHQKVTIIILTTISFLIQIINSFLPKTDHDCKTEECFDENLKDNYLYVYIIKKFGNGGYIVLFLFFYFIHFMMRDYSWVKFKYFLDIKSKPIFKVLLYIGIIGCCFVAIFLILVTKYPCQIIENVTYQNNTYTYIDNNIDKKVDFERAICDLIDYDKEANKLTFYYDNFFIFFKDYKNSNRMVLEILIILIYLVVNIIINFSSAMILKHVDPNAMLVNINFNYFISRMISYFIIHNGSKEYLTLVEFILLELCEFLAILAYMIYIELIELKFCKLDYHLRTNIERRSIEDARLFANENDDKSEDLNPNSKNKNEDEESQNDNISSTSAKIN